MDIISTENICKKFKQKKVLNSINFSIKENECVALLGKNGAGKSTLLNIIMGKYFPDEGNIAIGCMTKDIGFLPQKTNFPDDVKVNELIHFVYGYTDESLSIEEIHAILNFSKEQMNQFASKLSGGQQRLLDFCLAIINQPKFLIIDEPTSSMDTTTRYHFWECIKKLKQKGVTIIFTTHYIEEVHYCSDRVLLLDSGSLIADETPYHLKMMNEKKIIYFDSELFTQFKKELQDIIIANSISVIKADKLIELHFESEKTNKVIKELMKAGFPFKEIEITNTSLLDTIFNGEFIEGVAYD